MGAIDNMYGFVTPSVLIGSDTNTVDINTLGSYIVTYNLSDVAGNTAIEVIRTKNLVAVTMFLNPINHTRITWENYPSGNNAAVLVKILVSEIVSHQRQTSR